MKHLAHKRLLLTLTAAVLLTCWAIVGCSAKDEGDVDNVNVAPPVATLPDNTGKTDESFGEKGLLIYDGTPDHVYGRDVTIDRQNRIVVTGSRKGASFDSYPSMVVWRYLEDGKPDPSFDGDGRTTFDKDTQGVEAIRNSEILGATGKSALIDAQGRIVVTGAIYLKFKYANTSRRSVEFTKVAGAVWRYTADGELDASFNGDGLAVYLDDNGGAVNFEDSVIYDDKILIAGDITIVKPSCIIPNGNTTEYYKSLEDTPGICEKDPLSTEKSPRYSNPFNVYLPVMNIWLYDASGSPASNFRLPNSYDMFNEMIPKRTIPDSTQVVYSSGQAVSYDSEGRILVAGYSVLSPNRLADINNIDNRHATIWSFHPNGQLNPEFKSLSFGARKYGEIGWVRNAKGSYESENILISIARGPDNSILAAGHAKHKTTTPAGNAGKVKVRDETGKIVREIPVRNIDYKTKSLILNYRSDGSMEHVFLQGEQNLGFVKTDENDTTNDIHSIAVDHKGRILVMGRVAKKICDRKLTRTIIDEDGDELKYDIKQHYIDYDVYVARLTSAGREDTAFAQETSNYITYPGSDCESEYPASIALDSQGRVVVTGYAQKREEREEVYIRRHNNDDFVDYKVVDKYEKDLNYRMFIWRIK